MFRRPTQSREALTRINHAIDNADVKVWKTEKKFNDICNEVVYIQRRLTRLKDGTAEHTSLSYRLDEKIAKMNHLKRKHELAQDEARLLTRVMLSRLVTDYSNPENFCNGIPYLRQSSNGEFEPN